MPEQVSFRRALGALDPAIKLASDSWIILNSRDSALRDQVDDAPLRMLVADRHVSSRLAIRFRTLRRGSIVEVRASHHAQRVFFPLARRGAKKALHIGLNASFSSASTVAFIDQFY